MNEQQRKALSAIRFGGVPGAEGVWNPLRYHVDGLHPLATAALRRAVDTAANRAGDRPAGLVLSGEHGTGKTHLLGRLREYVQQQGGSYFMPALLDGDSFWPGVVHGIVDPLRDTDGGQLGRIIDRLSELAGCGKELRVRLHGTLTIGREHLDEFLGRMDDFDNGSMRECRDTLRALVLYQAGHLELCEIGHSFLLLEHGVDESDRATWGFREPRRAPEQICHDLFRLFALTGPIVLAVDRIDTVIARSGQAGTVADALIRLREQAERAILVAAGGPGASRLLVQHTVNADVPFMLLELSAALPGADTARTLVERRLATRYEEIGFEPPRPGWPVSPLAFEDRTAADHTPLRLLRDVHDHVRQCLDHDTITELEHFAPPGTRPASVIPQPGDPTALDAEFERLRRAADVVTPLDPRDEDERMSALLAAALHCHVLEQHSATQDPAVDATTGPRSALHARLRRTLDEATGAEEHWSFRSIGHTDARAVLTRLRAAALDAEIQPGSGTRHLVVVRNTPFPPGQATAEMLTAFHAAGGVVAPISEEDLRVFAALDTLLTDSPAGFEGWLDRRRPATRSDLLTRALTPPVPDPPGDAPTPDTDPARSESRSAAPPSTGIYRRAKTRTAPTAAAGGTPATRVERIGGEVTAAATPPPRTTPGERAATHVEQATGEAKPATSPTTLIPPGEAAAIRGERIPIDVEPGTVPTSLTIPGETAVIRIEETAEETQTGTASASTTTSSEPAAVRHERTAETAQTGTAPTATPIDAATVRHERTAGETRTGTPASPTALGDAAPLRLERVTEETQAGTAPASRTAAGAAGAIPLERVPGAAKAGTGSGARIGSGEVQAVGLGRITDGGGEFRVPLALLRRSTVILGGNRSGSTILLRRLVEGAALQGISSVVIDTRDELTRSGDPWPAPPAGWGSHDAERAAEYLENTDVVVWTPGREDGRALVPNPLPDFHAALGDPERFGAALDASVASLLPRSGLSERQIETGAMILRQAATYFAHRGGSSFRDFVALLADLPDGASTIRNAARRASDMARGLADDPVFGGTGEQLDPAALLTPAAGRRARISVVSFVGLPDDDQRQTFVDQLQSALLEWVGHNAADDRPLRGLLVLDDAEVFVPAHGRAASAESALKLATRAHEYGLGMVYATRSPHALHPTVTGSATTGFVGRLDESVEAEVAITLMQAESVRTEHISGLPAGHFYGATEGASFERITVPMCLSHHPAYAVTDAEVIQRARRRAG